MNHQVKKSVQEFLNKTKISPDTTILLFGSALDDNWSPESDIDLFFIEKNLAPSIEIKVINNITFEIQKDSFNQIVNNLEYERGNVRNRNLATMIYTSTVIKKGSDNIDALKEKACEILNSKTKYSSEDEKAWRDSINDYLHKCEKDITRNDPIAFQLDSGYVIQNLLDLFLAKNNSYLPQPKHLTNKLLTINPQFKEEFKKFTTSPNMSQKLIYLKRLIKFITDKA